MIPSIALMVATVGCVVCLYVIVRCCQVFETEAAAGTKVFAAAAAGASVLGIILLVVLAVDVVTSSSSLANDLDAFGANQPASAVNSPAVSGAPPARTPPATPQRETVGVPRGEARFVGDALIKTYSPIGLGCAGPMVSLPDAVFFASASQAEANGYRLHAVCR